MIIQIRVGWLGGDDSRNLFFGPYDIYRHLSPKENDVNDDVLCFCVFLLLLLVMLLIIIYIIIIIT